VFIARRGSPLSRSRPTVGGCSECRCLVALALNEPDTDPNYRLLFVLAVATVPVGIAGILLEHKLRVLFAKPLAAAIFLTINGVILLVGDACAATVVVTSNSGNSNGSRSRALGIGCSQIFALFAGISRSGISMVPV